MSATGVRVIRWLALECVKAGAYEPQERKENRPSGFVGANQSTRLDAQTLPDAAVRLQSPAVATEADRGGSYSIKAATYGGIVRKITGSSKSGGTGVPAADCGALD